MTPAAQSADPSADVFHAHELDAYFANLAQYTHIALAVSGGADSVALMLLVHNWLNRRPGSPQITVLTVNHKLREAAAAEAEWVKHAAEALHFHHQTLAWEGEKPRSGIQAGARRARYDLMTAYCRAATIPAIVTAHTSDDQAETFVMRLERDSGLDGLSAMEEAARRDGIDILRPLLMVSRRRIEAFLEQRKQPWLENPSNRDERYERVRIRRKLSAARSLGLSPEKLALSARRLRRARDALDLVTAEFLRTKVSLHQAGFARLRLLELFGLQEEVALRALTRMIVSVGGGGPLRLSKIEAYYQMMRATPRSATLGGCHLIAKDAELTIIREIGRMGVGCDSIIQPGETLHWDRRFTVTYGAEAGAAMLRVLGVDGFRAVKVAEGRFSQVPRLAAMTLPALWRDGMLCYAPFVDFAGPAPDAWSLRSHAEFTNAWTMMTPGREGPAHSRS